MDGVVLSGSMNHFLVHVRSLWHGRRPGPGTKYRMRDLARDSGGYLSGLRNLRNLTLSNILVEHISEGELHTCFSAYRETLTHLNFNTFSTSLGTFVTLINYFPNLTTLLLHRPTLKPDEGPVPSLSRPLRGKLHVRGVPAHSLEFFSRFSRLGVEFEELVIDSFNDPKTPGFAEPALRICPNTVKFLRLGSELRCK